MGFDDILGDAWDSVGDLGREIISRPPKHADGTTGQLPAGILTGNVGNHRLKQGEGFINKSKKVDKIPINENQNEVVAPTNIGNDLDAGFTTSDDQDYSFESQLDPGDLTNNIDNNDIDDWSISQINPGELTPNIGNDLGNETQSEPGELTPNIGNDLGDEPQMNPGELTANIGNDLEEQFIQENPGELTPNIGSNLGYEGQLNPGELTANIGNDLEEQFIQENPGELTPNIGNDLGLEPQMDPGELTNNIGNNDLEDPAFMQENPGELTPNIGSDLGFENQMDPGELTPNIGNDLEEQFIQENPGELTNNIGNNDLEYPTFIQSDVGELTPNIGIDLGFEEQTESTDNIGNDLGFEEQSDSIDNIGNDLGFEEQPTRLDNDNDLDDIFDNDTQNTNIGSNLEAAYINPLRNDSSIDLGSNRQSNAGSLTNNVGNNDLDERIFDNEMVKKNIGTKLDDTHKNPVNVKKSLNKETLYKNPKKERKNELVSITNKMKGRKNIGNDLGSLY